MMYDYHKYENMDCNNCKHLACSEIRAAMFSNKCSPKSRTYRTSNFLNTDTLDRGDAADFCVKDLATGHLAEKDKCTENAKRTVDYMFDKCKKDTSPFAVGSRRQTKNIA